MEIQIARIYERISPFFWYMPANMNEFYPKPYSFQMRNNHMEHLYSFDRERGYAPQDSILPSCLVSTPVHLHLHSISSLFELVKANASTGSGSAESSFTKLPMITYRCQKFSLDSCVRNLEAQLQTMQGKSTDFQNLVQQFQRALGDGCNQVAAFGNIPFY